MTDLMNIIHADQVAAGAISGAAFKEGVIQDEHLNEAAKAAIGFSDGGISGAKFAPASIPQSAIDPSILANTPHAVFYGENTDYTSNPLINPFVSTPVFTLANTIHNDGMYGNYQDYYGFTPGKYRITLSLRIGSNRGGHHSATYGAFSRLFATWQGAGPRPYDIDPNSFMGAGSTSVNEQTQFVPNRGTFTSSIGMKTIEYKWYLHIPEGEFTYARPHLRGGGGASSQAVTLYEAAEKRRLLIERFTTST